MSDNRVLFRRSATARFVNRTKALTPWLRVGRVSARLEFKAADLWMGVYVSPDENWSSGTVWVCLIPGLPLHIDWWPRRSA